MISTSAEYKSIIADNDVPRNFTAKATIILADSTVLNTAESDIIKNGVKHDDATSDNNSFQIGSAIINEHTLILNNIDGKFNRYDFSGAIITPYSGLRLSQTIEWLKKGTFTVNNSNTIASTVILECKDNMTKFEKPFSEVTTVFPVTAFNLLYDVCLHCGIVLATTDFLNKDYIINRRPDDTAITCREIVAYIAMISGNFARCNVDGALELKWYDTGAFETASSLDGGTFDSTTPYATGDTADGGNFTDFNSGDNIDGGTFADMARYHHIYALSQSTIGTDDVVITGVQVKAVGIDTDYGETALFGSTGYVIEISNNPLIQENAAATIANSVGAKIVGMRFRTCSITALADPSREAGDVAYLSDRKGNTYQILLTNVGYTIGNSQTISCDAETPTKNSSTRYSAATKAIIEARKNAEVQLTAYDLIVQQMTNVIANGLGVFSTRVTDESGGTIEYLHDKKLMSDSAVRWFTTTEGTIEQNQVGGVWTTVSGTDKQGNALYNVLYARKLKADILQTGKIYSDDGSTLIDMAYGVANSDNVSESDNIQDGFPLTLDFYIDSKVSKITGALLNYKQKSFRTYSTTASDGGGSTVTSQSSQSRADMTQGVAYASTGNTGPANAVDNHYHSFSVPEHEHPFSLPNHTHAVDIPPHAHNLNFGIQEQAISDYAVDVYVDGTKRASVSDQQGIIDLTTYITTAGWHTIELRSTTLKRVSAQINIKSYIKS